MAALIKINIESVGLSKARISGIIEIHRRCVFASHATRRPSGSSLRKHIVVISSPLPLSS